MDPLNDRLLNINRRALLKGAGAGGLGLLGGPALGQLLSGGEPERAVRPHFAPKAKRIIYLFQEEKEKTKRAGKKDIKITAKKL